MEFISAQAFNLLLITVILLNLFLALLIFSKNRRKHINISFSFFVVATALWMVSNYTSNVVTNIQLSFLLNKLIFVFSSYMMYLLLYFSLVFPYEIIHVTKKRLFILLVPIIIANVLTFLNLVIKGVTFLPLGGTGVIFGQAIVYFAAIFLAYFIASIFILGKKFFTSRGRERVQLQYLLFGISIAMIFGIITNLILPVFFNVFVLNNYAPFFTLIIIIATSYAIIRHRLLDIRLIIARSVSYSLFVVWLASIYTAAILFVSHYFLKSQLNNTGIIIYAGVAIFITFTFQPIRDFLEKITNKIFFKHGYSSSELLSKLTIIMATTLNLDDLSRKTLMQLLDTMNVERGAFAVFNKEEILLPAVEKFETINISLIHELSTLFDIRKEIIFDEEVDEGIKQRLRKLNISIISPLFSEGVFRGLLIMGEKKSGEVYSEQDIDVLHILVPEVSIAINNALSYEEIKRFNVTLKEEVDKATEDLQKANEHLKQLDKLKDEFVSLASHELRTPMTVVKSYLWMVLQDKKAHLTDQQKLYLERAFTASDGLINLVNDMLNVSRIESGRFSIEKQDTDVVDLVKTTVTELAPEAEKRGLSLKFVLESEIPKTLYIDPERIKQILINLIGNSMKFTHEHGKITVSIMLKDGMVNVQVKDNGVGISKENVAKLFQKFGLLRESYEKSSAQGTGLGLYICRSIVELHGGKIWAESEGEGKGSMFTFTLPTHPNISEPRADQTVS